MRVLVTGDKGYIGAVLVPMLLQDGHSVTGLDADWFEHSAFSELPAQISSMRKDVRDVEVADLKGFDAVIHLAALSNDPLGDLDSSLTDDINHRASVRLGKLAKEAGVERFLFSSSCSTYGAAGGDALLNEEAELRPVTAYGKSKVCTEEGLAKLADSGFSPTFLRNATAYGVSARLRFDLVLNNLVAWAYTTGRIHIKSDGTPWRPIVHIADISRAFIAMLTAPRERIHCQAFNVGLTTENYQIRQLADIVNEIVPDCKIEFAADGGPDLRCYRVDFSKLARILPECKLQWTAREGAKEIYRAVREYGLKPDEFEGPRFRRISHIQSLISTGRLDAALRWRDRGNSEEKQLQMSEAH
ncbi:MAG TPA: SDR family oxidoreductase [Acidobacteriaceae bacterium]|jgi:nucleoside-diphosphate-sugar epimerase|nr:SDR family oxidoreductase [Acidobacteriaceae bacterium]